MTIFKKLFDFFLFSSLYISVVAGFMVYQTYTLLLEQPVNLNFLAFVFFSTLCSYNFHWMLTPHSPYESERLKWRYRHKGFHLFFFITGLWGVVYYFLYLKSSGFWIGVSVLLTFLYSAPKIPYPPFQMLKKFAIGKTIFLALVWTYVTSVLPLLIEQTSINHKALLFWGGEFFFIYGICILFDYRDRQQDIADGIRSMITYFQEKGITRLFYFSGFLSGIFFLWTGQLGTEWTRVSLLLIPVLLLVSLFQLAKKNFSDYLYYFVLDGLMMLPGLLLWIMHCF